ncbi:MAG: hypothetical protein H6698_02610 [Myxococcales bacterium]|nr:hypothetical protein [Myxococcales bacterium]MCB9519888.1 hypothetical protein [Myxococcales bacterium]MCB9533205.1 hypothetical protein [Myxococcales bacterium]
MSPADWRSGATGSPIVAGWIAAPVASAVEAASARLDTLRAESERIAGELDALRAAVRAEEAARAVATVADRISTLRAELEQWRVDVEERAVTAALAAAAALAGDAIASDPDRARSLVSAAIAAAPGPPLRVRASASLAGALVDLDGFDISVDPALGPADFVVELASGKVDGGLSRAVAAVAPSVAAHVRGDDG